MLEKVQAKIQNAIDMQYQTQADEEELALLAEYTKEGDEELKELVVKLSHEK
jgi:hypothetical protein